MSLAIDVDRVAQVLLPDGVWHEVADQSFEMDAYEYFRRAEFKAGGGDTGIRLRGGQEKYLVPATGARWNERTADNRIRKVFCPVTAIQAVAYG